MQVYLDNAATTKVSDAVVEKMINYYKNDYGNPSSIHSMGLDAELVLKSARTEIAKVIQANLDEVYFTSGGTEANNLAIRGVLNLARRDKMNVITTKIEHHSVLKTIEEYEKKGFDVTYVNVDAKGYIDLEHLKSLLKDSTALVSIAYVNNEIGTVQNIPEISRIIKENSKAVFHVDAVQAFMKIPIKFKNCIDLMSISAHKIHGPKGVGAVIIKKGIAVAPMLTGGHQQNKIRPGTENVPGIAGFSVAVKEAEEKFKENVNYIREIKEYFISRLSEISEYKINGSSDVCGIVNVSFRGMRGEVLLHTLESKGIFVSTGSACTSKAKKYSHVLEELDLDNEELEGAIRFSFSKYITKEMVDYTIEVLKESIRRLEIIIKGR